MKRFKDYKDYQKPPAIFLVNDVGNSTLPLLNFIDKRISFDMVSCQMSMHYLFESEKTLRQFLTNVTERLEPGGIFIGTTLDSQTLVKKLRTVGMENDEYTFGNYFYSVKFMQSNFPKD